MASRNAVGLVLAALAVGALVPACDGNGASSSGGGGSASSTGDGSSPACTEIDVKDFDRYQSDGKSAWYIGVVTVPLGDGATFDRLDVRLAGASGGGVDGEKTGMFDLGTGPDANTATCSRCLTVQEDVDRGGLAKRAYFQKSGTLEIDPASKPLDGALVGKLVDVTFVEVSLDDANPPHSTPVPGGGCVHIALVNLHIAPPDGWTCNPGLYQDGNCDCGCGAYDTDCVNDFGRPDHTSKACMTCDDEGACSLGCVQIDDSDNSKCI